MLQNEYEKLCILGFLCGFMGVYFTFKYQHYVILVTLEQQTFMLFCAVVWENFMLIYIIFAKYKNIV